MFPNMDKGLVRTIAAIGLCLLPALPAAGQAGCYFGVCPGDPGTEFPETQSTPIPVPTPSPLPTPSPAPTEQEQSTGTGTQNPDNKTTGKTKTKPQPPPTPQEPAPPQSAMARACLGAFGTNGEFSWQPRMGTGNALAVCEAALREYPDDDALQFRYAAARDLHSELGGTPADNFYAVTAYRELAAKGSVEAKYALATMFDEDAGVSMADALVLLREVIANNHSDALTCLSLKLLHEEELGPLVGSKIDMREIERRASSSATCTSVLLEFMRTAQDVGYDFSLSYLDHLRAGAVTGDSWAMKVLGDLYALGVSSVGWEKRSGAHFELRQNVERGGNWLLLAYYTSLPMYTAADTKRNWEDTFLWPDSAKAIQTALKAQGIYDGAIDGQFGPRSRAALARFVESQMVDPLFQRMRDSEPLNPVLAPKGPVHLGNVAIVMAMQ